MPKTAIVDIRRKEIIKAFFGVIAERGLNGATIRQVAESAGMSVGLLQHYFPNKEEMIRAVIDYATSEYISALQNKLKKYESATDRLRFVLKWITTIDQFDRKWFRNFAEFKTFAHCNTDVNNALDDFKNRLTTFLAEVIQEGISAKEFREVDPTAVANYLLATGIGLVELYLINPKSLPLETIRKDIVEAIFTMVSTS